MTAIKTTIVSTLTTAFGLMTTAAGYNFTWGDLDDYDPASRVYPCAFFSYNEEDGVDEDDNSVEHYTNYFDFIVRIIVNNTINVDTSLNNAEDDFKRLLALQTEALCAVGMLDYQFISAGPRTYTNVRKYPGETTITFRINYRQQQISPSLT